MRSASKKKSKRHNKPNNKRFQIQKNINKPDHIYKQYNNYTKTKLHATNNKDVKKKNKKNILANDMFSKAEE